MPVNHISATQAWDELEAQPQAQLVDVRCGFEWEQGIPDLTDLSRNTKLISWQETMGGPVNHNFGKFLEEQVPDKNTPVIFMCKLGGRSQMAAEYAAQAGYINVGNMLGGYIGNPSAANSDGWLGSKLPTKLNP